MTEAFDIKKIVWSCRRGMLELDVILIPFAQQHFDALTQAQKSTFVDLLEEADPDLFNWLMGHGKPEQSNFADIINHIRQVMKVA